MGYQKCVSLTVRTGIWDAFTEMASQKQVDTLELLEEILIDYIVNNLDDYHKFPDLVDDQDIIRPRPPC